MLQIRSLLKYSSKRYTEISTLLTISINANAENNTLCIIMKM